jgi:hypothetical protein
MATSLKLIVLGGLLAFSFDALGADDVRPGYAEWLRQGCSAIVLSAAEREPLPYGQAQMGRDVGAWMHGFLSGVHATFLTQDEEDAKFYTPPDEWYDSKQLAPLILVFLRDHKINPTTKAREVMMAWYYMSHPEAATWHQLAGETMLDDIAAKPAQQAQ